VNAPAYYAPYVWLFGGQRVSRGDQGIEDRGEARLRFSNTPSMVYNFTSASLPFNGSQSVFSNETTITLGVPARRSPSSALLRTGFSVAVSVTPASASAAVIFDFSGTDSVDDTKQRRVTLVISTPGKYALVYTSGGAGDLVLFHGPPVVIGARADLLVRCVPGLLLCTLLNVV
jgi:hypothetical protein